MGVVRYWVALGFMAVAPWVGAAPFAVVGLTFEGRTEFPTPPARGYRLFVLDFADHSLRPVDWPAELCGSCAVTGPYFYGSSIASTTDGTRVHVLALGRMPDGALADAIVEVDPRAASVTRAVLYEGHGRVGMAAHPHLPLLYVSSIGFPTGRLQIVSQDTLEVVATIPLPPGGDSQSVSRPVLTADGRYGYLASQPMLFKFDAATGQVVAQRDVGGNTYPFLDKRRNRLYLADGRNDVIRVVHPDTLVELGVIVPGAYLDSAAVDADGMLLVDRTGIDEDDDWVARIDPRNGSVLTYLRYPGRFFVPGGDGRLHYRLRRNRVSMSDPMALSSDVLTIYNHRTFRLRDAIPLETRVPDDPGRQNSRMVLNRIAFLPEQADAVEYYHAGLDHYFVTADAGEVDRLDRGELPDWHRTGETIPVLLSDAGTDSSAVSVCRFYGRPERGLNSHFYSASLDECEAVGAGFNGAWTLETDEAFYVFAAIEASGSCPTGARPVFRLWNARPDSNHRYTTSQAIRAEMVARGYVSEGYGPDGVAFCVRP